MRVVARSLSVLAVSAALVLVAVPAYSATLPDAAIDGRVTTSSGAGLSEIRIDAVQSDVVVASTTTDATGSYRFDVADGVYSLRLTPPTAAFNPSLVTAVEAPRNWPLNIVLTPPATGRVFLTGNAALDSGQPLTGGTAIHAGGGVRIANDGFFSFPETSGTIGTWMFSGRADTPTTTLYVSASGGPSVTMLQDIDTQLIVPTTQTLVTVRDGNGAPLAGASVRLSVGATDSFSSTFLLPGGTTPYTADWTAIGTTDSVGTVRLTRPELTAATSGTLTVGAPSALWTSATSTVALPATGGSLTQQLTRPMVTMTGQVSYSTGVSIPGVQVIPFDPTSRVNGGVSADSNGNYSVRQPAGFTGNWMLSSPVQSGLVSPDPLYFILTGGALRTWTADATQNLSLPATTSRVRVVDPAGNPVAQASVIAQVQDGSGSSPAQVRVLAGEPVFSGTWTSRAMTDASGYATLPVLTTENAATVQVRVASSNNPLLIPATFATTSSALPGSTFTLSSQAIVKATGKVSYSDGTPVNAAVVIPMDPSSNVNGGNSADSSGVYAQTKPFGFTGFWTVSTRPQSSLAVRDPLTFSLSGSALRTWSSDFAQDFTLPKTLYRMRVVDTSGNPIAHATIGVVSDINGASTARVAVLQGQPDFTGYWAGYDVTGTDGYAQVPALAMTNSTTTKVTVSTDPGTRFISRTVSLASSNLAETVVVLQSLIPTITSVSSTSVTPGDTITLKGTNLGGLASVTIGGVPQQFVVDSDSQVRVQVASNSPSGPLVIVSPGGTLTPASITVTSRDLTISSSALPTGMVGSAFQAQLTGTGGLAPYKWTQSSGALPTGLFLSSTGAITGMPTRAQTSTIGVTVTDARGTSVSRVLTWTINPKPATVPGPITALTANAGAGRISLAWSAPLDTGGNVITGYRVEQSTNGSTWAVLNANTGTTVLGTSFTVTPQVNLWFRVAAVNAAGVGAFGPTSAAGPVAGYGIAGVPQVVTATRTNSSQVTLRWAAPVTNGGTPVTGYRVRTSPNGVTWTTVADNVKTLAALVQAPSGRKTYLQVATINLAGLSAYVTVVN